MALPALLPSVLAALEKWSEWKRIREAPQRLDALEEKLSQIQGATPTAQGLPALPDADMQRVDAFAASQDITRSEAIRRLVAKGLGQP